MRKRQLALLTCRRQQFTLPDGLRRDRLAPGWRPQWHLGLDLDPAAGTGKLWSRWSGKLTTRSNTSCWRGRCLTRQWQLTLLAGRRTQGKLGLRPTVLILRWLERQLTLLRAAGATAF
jgi:hypothetical protein